MQKEITQPIGVGIVLLNSIHKEPEIKGGLKALKDRGIKIMHYEEHTLK
jgi:hypothetical protein